ncbi:MAG: MFS transporter [Armatimonadota bacterium]|nr:MAG: MFS transporter [Armatimonadota bacterium]
MMQNEKRAVLIAASLSSFVTPFMGSALNVAIPAIGRQMHATAVMVSWVVSVYLIASAVFLLPFGRLADMLGRKRVFLTGVAFFSVFSVFCAISPSIFALIASRAAQGVAAAMVFGTAVSLITSAIPPGERGKTLGYNTATVYIGLSVGPVIGGFLTQTASWRAIFLIVTVLAGVTWLFARRIHSEWAPAKGEPFDTAGAVLYCLALTLLMSAVSLKQVGAVLVGVAILLLVIWGMWEGREAHPLLDLRLFRESAVFTFSTLAALLNYSATFSIGYLMSLYLQTVQGFTPQSAGMLLLVQPVVQAAFSPLAGALSDKREPRIVASAGMLLTTFCLLAYALMPYRASIPFLVAVLATSGLGFALFSSPNVNAIMSAVPSARYGVASSVVSTARMLGQSFSMALILLIFSVTMHGMPLSPEHGGVLFRSMHIAFGISTVLSLLGVFASLARGRMHVHQ